MVRYEHKGEIEEDFTKRKNFTSKPLVFFFFKQKNLKFLNHFSRLYLH